MRRWIAWSARLYPGAWRQRYGAEFDALLEDAGAGWPEFLDVLGGALKMQMTTGNTWKLAAGFALAGAVAAVAVSFRLPPRYISSAVIRIAAEPGATARLQDLQTEVLSRGRLTEIIVKPSLDLYKQERARLPMEDIVLDMRNHDIRIRPAGPGGGATMAFQISFGYPDAAKAQAVVSELVAKITEQNLLTNRQPAPPPGRVEVLDPASLPKKSVGPNRLAYVAAGLGVGLLLGLLAAAARRRPKRTLRIAVSGLAGCLLAVALSFLITDRYTSTAVMRFTEAFAPKGIADAVAATSADQFSRMGQSVISRSSLAAIVTKPSLDLYRKERANASIEDIVENMRKHDLAIARMNFAAFRISFTYPDRYKARDVVRELVTRFAELNITEQREATVNAPPDVVKMLEMRAGPNLEVLDPASLPEAPIYPRRLPIAIAGLIAGLLLGALILRGPENDSHKNLKYFLPSTSTT